MKKSNDNITEERKINGKSEEKFYKEYNLHYDEEFRNRKRTWTVHS